MAQSKKVVSFFVGINRKMKIFLAYIKKKQYLCAGFSVRDSRTANITRESQVIIVRKLRTISQKLLILSRYERARFGNTFKEIDVKRA